MDKLANVLKNTSGFRRRLLRWYDANHRPLPWRGTRDPYRIWVSEIMLQQTRVNAVLSHYRRFLEKFPSVRALAAASEADVLTMWSGLGYYRRARMMRVAAQSIVEEHRGEFPRKADELQRLAGIGRYTAAAIASIAFDEPRAVVDGNVERVVSRLAGRPLAERHIWEFAQSAIGPGRPGDFNQAMMELGATVCTPQNPACDRCPVRGLCGSRDRVNKPQKLPRRKPGELHYLYARRNGSVMLVQRDAGAGLMAAMWELPPAAAKSTSPLLQVRHSITTTDYKVSVYPGRGRGGDWVPIAKVAELPLTGLARKVLRRLGAIASVG